MNEIFDIKRFGEYLKADLTGAYSKYGITLLSLSLSGVIVYIFFQILRMINMVQAGAYTSGVSQTVFTLAVIILVCGMPSTLYGHITDKRSGSDYLMLPASTLEKYASMILVTLVIVPAVFVLVFLGTDALIALIDRHYTVSAPDFLRNFSYLLEWEGGSRSIGFGAVSCAMIYFGIFLLGALFFKRHKISYTIITVILVAIVIGILGCMIGGALLWNNKMDSDSIDRILDFIDNRTWLLNLWNFIFLIAIIVAGYFRVRKIQH